jgi:hypothetical protein
VSLRTEYGTTMCDSFRARTIARPFRTGFAGSHTLLAHFVRLSSLKGGPRRMAGRCREFAHLLAHEGSRTRGPSLGLASGSC